MSQPDNSGLQDAGLAADVDFKNPLKRVSYQPGMLLGLEATRAEQNYHRRHLNRHNYWLHGSGTVAGLRVYVKPVDPAPSDDTTQARLRLHVSPGIGVDGLGREVTVSEPYCIDLGAWLTTQYEDKENDRWGALIRDGYDEKSNLLWLKVTMRYQESPSGLQPVMGTEVNAGTDPVQPSRIQDGVLFELVAERPADAPKGDHPFAAHNALKEYAAIANDLSQDERDRIETAAGEEKQLLLLAARLLHALSNGNDALAAQGALDYSEANTTRMAELGRRLARTLLARISIRLTPARELIVNPHRITVDNLSRPFLFNAATLAQLIRK